MNEAVDELMVQAQVFASAWSLVGGRFDTGHCSDAAKEAKLELEKMVRAALAAPAQQPWQYTPPAQERIDALELEVRQLTEQIAELRHAPTPQADSQPAPLREGEWINDAGRIKWLMWRVQDLEAKLAARAPADSVLEDAARWQMAVLIGNEVMLHPEKRTHPAAVKAYMDAVHSGLDLTGAVDAARKQGATHDI